MTAKSQTDNTELCENILAEILRVYFNGEIIKGNYTEAVEVLTKLISKREIEARIETVQIVDSTLRFENMPLHIVQAESLKQYIRQLEAQLTELQEGKNNE